MRRIIIIEDDGQAEIGVNPYIGLDEVYYNYNPCSNCVNNPMVNPNASGICHCVLPYMQRTTKQNHPNGYFQYYTTCSFDTQPKANLITSNNKTE